MFEVPDQEAQSVLRAAARLVLQLPYRSSVIDLMHRQLHWLDIRSRVRLKIGLLVFKYLQGLAHGTSPTTVSRCQYRPLAPPCVQSGFRSVLSSSLERKLRQSTLVASSKLRPPFGTRSLTIYAILNSPLVFLRTD